MAGNYDLEGWQQMTVWPVIAIIATVLFVIGLVLFFRPKPWARKVSPIGDTSSEKLPMTGLQKRAWWGLGIGLAFTVAVVLLIASEGATDFLDDDRMRYTAMAIVFGGGALYIMVMGSSFLRRTSTDRRMDERDRVILSKVPRIQGGAVLITVGAWAVALTETYWEQKAIPLVYPYLIVWSCLIVHLLAHAAGILISYWKMDDRA
jgi:uncharacterized protein YjeT (DUF2065 family)